MIAHMQLLLTRSLELTITAVVCTLACSRAEAITFLQVYVTGQLNWLWLGGYRQTCVTSDTCQLAVVTKEAFQEAVQAAAHETFESARLQELLYIPPTARMPADVAEAAHRLRRFKYFHSMDPSHVAQLAAAAGVCPCPRFASPRHHLHHIRLPLAFNPYPRQLCHAWHAARPALVPQQAARMTAPVPTKPPSPPLPAHLMNANRASSPFRGTHPMPRRP